MVSFFFVNSLCSSIKGLIFTKKYVDCFFRKYGKFYEASVFGLTTYLLSYNCKKCSHCILTWPTFFLSFWKTVRKCWKNCALPVFFDNNNMKKEKSVSPLSFFLLRAWLWSLRVPLISIVQASKPTRRPRHFLCFQLCTVIPLDHIYTQAKFLKSLLKDLFAFCLTFWWCTVLYSETYIYKTIFKGR